MTVRSVLKFVACALLLVYQAHHACGRKASAVRRAHSAIVASARPFSQTSSPHWEISRWDSNDNKRTLATFESRSTRQGFVRKVYAIFCSQILATIAVTAVMLKNPTLTRFILRHFDVIGAVSTFVSLGIATAFSASEYLRYSFPINIVVLGIYTVCQAVNTGVVASFVGVRNVCIGSMHTLTAFAVLTAVAMQPNPKYDMSTLGQVLVAALLCLCVGVPLAAQFGLSLQDNLLAALTAIVFAGFVVFDTSMIVGGKHKKRQYSPNDYILASLGLYQDVVGLFVQILRIVSTREREDENESRRR